MVSVGESIETLEKRHEVKMEANFDNLQKKERKNTEGDKEKKDERGGDDRKRMKREKIH